MKHIKKLKKLYGDIMVCSLDLFVYLEINRSKLNKVKAQEIINKVASINQAGMETLQEAFADCSKHYLSQFDKPELKLVKSPKKGG